MKESYIFKNTLRTLAHLNCAYFKGQLSTDECHQTLQKWAVFIPRSVVGARN